MANKKIDELIKNNFALIATNFDNGIKEYKSFREVCTILKIDYNKASSDSKTHIINELNRYCDCGRIENSYSFIIREIYDEPKNPNKQTRNRHSIYAEAFYCILIYTIYNKNDYDFDNNDEIISDRYKLFNLLGLTNDWFYKPNEFKDFDEDIYDEVRDNCFEIAQQAFYRGLENLSKKGKITYSKCSLVRYIKKTSYIKQIAQSCDEIVIQEIKQNILETNRCKTEHTFVQEYGFEHFKTLINNQLKEYSFEYLSSVYRITITNKIIDEYKNIFGNMTTTETHKFITEKKLEINRRILNQFPAKNEYEFNSAYTHSPFRAHNYNERKNDIITDIGKKLRNEQGKIMISINEMKKYYIEKRNEYAKKIIEIKGLI